MTTIAAIQGDGWSVVGYDSQVTADENKIVTLPKETPKVAKNGAFLLGAAGDLRAVNLLSYSFKAPTPSEADYGVNLDKFVSTKLVPALKSCFDSAQYGEKGEQDSVVLVVVGGVVYEIGSNYEWCRDSSGLYALGSGGSYALGALHQAVGRKKLNIQQARVIVKKAVEIASQLDVNTGGPIYVVSQTQ